MSTKCNKENAREYLKMADVLLIEVARILNTVWDDENMLFKDATGKHLNWDDMFTYKVYVPTDKGNISQLLFFGDGTIEFQYEHCDEAFNWADLELQDLKKVLEVLHKC